MGDNLQNVLNQALALSALDRVRIIESLQDSLDERHADIEQAWIPVLLERSRQIDAGEATFSYPEPLRRYREAHGAA
jgi:Putative addiction module component